MNNEWLIPFITLFFMELVLGIDNIIFITILVDKAPITKRRKIMRTGILLALGFRIVLLFFIGWLVSLNKPFLHVGIFSFSGRDLILFIGGFFLMVKTIIELKHKLSKQEKEDDRNLLDKASFGRIILQIIAIDIIFSFDSILTAVGLVDSIGIMITAVIASMLVMLIMAERISSFINTNPTVKLLALSFLLLIGGYLIFEAFHIEFDKKLLYFGMGFAFFNEILNIQFRKIQGKETNGI